MSDKSEWEMIIETYSEYYNSYPDDNNININFSDHSADYPLRYGISNGIEMIIDSIEYPIDTKYLLQLNDELPDIDELSDETMGNLPIQLTKIAQVKVTEDHREYWKETYRRADDYFGGSDEYDNFLRLFKIATVLACWQTSTPKGEDATFVQKESYLIVSYIIYPLLESLAAGLCGGDINPVTGEVKPGKKVRKLCQSVEYYTENDTVSNVGALLYHIESEVGNEDIRDSLIEMRKMIAEFGEKTEKEAYGVLKSWRNDLLHGSKKPIGQFVIIMNLLCLLVWKTMLYPGEWFQELPSHQSR
jgi:hypothetical protein